MEFGSGVVGAEPPVDGDPRCVVLGLVGRDLALQCGGGGVSPLAAGAAQCAEFDLRIPRKQLNIGLMVEQREQVQVAAESVDLTPTSFAAPPSSKPLPPEHRADIDTDGVGFLAWLMAVLSAARRSTPTRA